MSKSTPKAPDYAAAAAEQAASSREVTEQQTWANRPDQVTPFGTQSWASSPEWDPSTEQWLNKWTQTTDLNPQSQAALDSQMNVTTARSQLAESLTGRMANEYGQEMDWGGFSDMGQTPDVPQYGQNLPSMGTGPQANNYQGQDIQRGLDTSNLQGIDPSQKYYDKAGDAIYDKFASRMDPRFQRDNEQLRNRLYAQGLREGDKAFTNATQDQAQNQNDAYEQAGYQATIGAGQEASRMYGMDSGTRQQQYGELQGNGAFYNQSANQALQQDLAVGGANYGEGMQGAKYQDAQRAALGNEQLQFGQAGFGQNLQASNYQNQLRQQQIAESLQQRGFSLNEINAMLSGQQVSMPTMPTFNTAQRSEGLQSLQATDMQQQANMDIFGAQQAQTQGLMSGASSMMMFSDRRLKKDVTRIGSIQGIALYAWTYLWGEKGVGVMADEVDHIPGAVVIHPSGYKMVDYGVIYG